MGGCATKPKTKAEEGDNVPAPVPAEEPVKIAEEAKIEAEEEKKDVNGETAVDDDSTHKSLETLLVEQKEEEKTEGSEKVEAVEAPTEEAKEEETKEKPSEPAPAEVKAN